MKYALILGLFMSMSAFGVTTLKCQYNNDLNEFEFSLHGFEKKSFNKKFQMKDKNYYVSVADLKKPSEVDDFVVIEKESYKMTYSLKCSLYSNEVAKAYAPKQF